MEQFHRSNIHGTDPNLGEGYINGNAGRDSWRVMFDHVYTDISRLMSREKALVKTEVKEKLTEAKAATVSMAIAGVLMFVGVFALVATAIILLAKAMDLGLAAGLVTAALFVVGAIMYFGAKKKLTADNLIPRQSIDTLGQITTTFKERINEYKSHSHH